MNAIDGLLHGLQAAITPTNLLWLVVGCLLGTLVGILPGLGPPATIAILLPLATGFEPATGLIMMAGIYYGAKYGGSTTSILMNIPGESSSVVTCIDGYEMAKTGPCRPGVGHRGHRVVRRGHHRRHRPDVPRPASPPTSR